SDFIYLSSEWDSPLGARSLHWRLIDALGRVVKRVRVNDSSLREKVDVSDLQPGVYFWEVLSIKGVLGSGKLVKE
ncbi:MAG: T9SS type A sorting domain-containing protein, partial [Saprospiraceae bacterium]|nr:T9SS type A sorting domain-containing protein [Saprospiraceae bacterium]